MSEGTIVSGGVMHIHNSSGAMHIHNSSTEEAKAAGSQVLKPARTVWKFSFEEVQGTSPYCSLLLWAFPMYGHGKGSGRVHSKAKAQSSHVQDSNTRTEKYEARPVSWP